MKSARIPALDPSVLSLKDHNDLAHAVSRQRVFNTKAEVGLYSPGAFHDACGVIGSARQDGVPTRELVSQSLKALANMEHRGACGCDPDSSDGAGILTQIPHEFFLSEFSSLPQKGQYGVANLFLPRDDAERLQGLVNAVLRKEGLRALHWREVPTDDTQIGFEAKRQQPRVFQVFISRPDGLNDKQYEKLLYYCRKQIRREALDNPSGNSGEALYCTSCSAQTIVYKSLCLPSRLAAFYPDLNNNAFLSALAIAHSRFATNALPRWMLAHPYQVLAHNGEINTVEGNRRAWKAQERRFGEVLFKEFPYGAEPAYGLVSQHGSDTRSLDGAAQLMLHSGFALDHALRVLMPEAYENRRDLPPEMRAFYRYHAGLVAPWDGPASVIASSGDNLVAVLDRCGLRPQRVEVSKSGTIIIGSEAGPAEVSAQDLKERRIGRAGGMFSFSPATGLQSSEQVVERLLREDNGLYERAVGKRIFVPAGFKSEPEGLEADKERRLFLQRAFGYTTEDKRVILTPLAKEGAEAIGSMGDDTPLAVLSQKARPLFHYFKQIFAQVTNPPIDPIREKYATTLSTWLGPTGNLLEPSEANGERIELDSPIINDQQMDAIQSKVRGNPKFNQTTVATTFSVSKQNSLKDSLDRICQAAEDAVRGGAGIIVLSDRTVDKDNAPIPSLLALSAVHQHLLKVGLRMQVSLLVDSGEPREVHDIACLIGCGADVVNPYLLFAEVRNMASDLDLTPVQAEANTKKALESGLLKVMSKMGIAPVASYRGAQLFEAIGISSEVINRYFDGITSRIGGVSLEHIEADARHHHHEATRDRHSHEAELPAGGFYQVVNGGEYHAINGASVEALQQATKLGPESQEGRKQWLAFRQHAQGTVAAPLHLRNLLKLRKAGQSVPLDEVESAESIMRRFTTGAMSFGSISIEAHETLARAMNEIGGRSNSGEGGEKVDRRENPDTKSKIRQVASGRFGATTHYLATAEEMQIKMAQGAKPGEGGQLQGAKVNEEIAATRYTVKGVTLISPPPHHDIYSIEDLAQLLRDLHEVNPKAIRSVKLVSEAGVGTIAAGVAKAGANKIIISGAEGGTGASPLSSLKHAGGPWELGLAHAQQVLVAEGLRKDVMLQTDGQMLTGLDAIYAALLGAEEFAFATAPLITMGCNMQRVCHLDSCGTGIATQDPELRKGFKGTKENVINYFKFVADEMRHYMAWLGVRSLDELIGRVELLERASEAEITKHHGADSRIHGLDFSAMLSKPASDAVRQHQSFRPPSVVGKVSQEIAAAVDEWLKGNTATLNIKLGTVTSSNLSLGTRISGDLARQFGEYGLNSTAEGSRSIIIEADGDVGQSCGAWLIDGVTLRINGGVNDYVGKGLSGGTIVVRPSPDSVLADAPHEHAIAGNTCFFGAIRGYGFLAGKAGERLAVRNSGAHIVTEGAGGNACEYMTGGAVAILGEIGPNPFAGMSGGVAYIMSSGEEKDSVWIEDVVKKTDFEVERVTAKEDALLNGLLNSHAQGTDSPRAKEILGQPNAFVFIRVKPKTSEPAKK